MRAPRRHLHLDAAPRELVGTLPADLHRGGSGDRQLHLTAEGLESAIQLLAGRRIVTFQHVSLGIARGGSARQIDVRHVPLVEAHEA